MGIIGYIILGLIIGAIAKAIVPGRQGGGIVATMLIGVVGAVVGGLLGNLLFDVGLEDFWSLQTWLLALAGTIVVLLIWGALTGRNARRA